MQIPENSNAADALCRGCLRELSQSCLFDAFRDFQKISRSTSFRPPPGAIGVFLHRSVNDIESELERIAAYVFYASDNNGTIAPDLYYVRSTSCSSTYAPLKASRKRKCACCDNCYNYCHNVARFLNSRRDDKERESKKKASESDKLAARLASYVTKNKNLRAKVQYKNRQIAVLREKLASWREKEEKNGGMISLNQDECETWSIFFRYACDLIDKEYYRDDQMELRLLKKELFEAEFKHMGQFNKNHDKRGIKRCKISARVLNYAVQLSTKVGKTAYEEECIKRPGLPSWSAIKKYLRNYSSKPGFQYDSIIEANLMMDDKRYPRGMRQMMALVIDAMQVINGIQYSVSDGRVFGIQDVPKHDFEQELYHEVFGCVVGKEHDTHTTQEKLAPYLSTEYTQVRLVCLMGPGFDYCIYQCATSAMTGCDIRRLMHECMVRLHLWRFDVAVVIADGGSNNRSYQNAVFTQSRSIEEPSLTQSMLHPVTNRVVYFGSDTSHAIKKIVAALLNEKRIIMKKHEFGEYRVSLLDIYALWKNLNKCGINYVHSFSVTDFIKTPRQAQRVGPCIKVLGSKTIDLIDEAKRRYLQDKDERFSDYKRYLPMREVCFYFTVLFDILNNRRTQLTINSTAEVCFLMRMLEWWRSWKKECFARMEKIHGSDAKEAQLYQGFFTKEGSDDLECALATLIQLLSSFTGRNSYDGVVRHIICSTYNSDCIENAFGDIRHIAGDQALTSRQTYIANRTLMVAGSHVKGSKTAMRNRNAGINLSQSNMEALYVPCKAIEDYKEGIQERMKQLQKPKWQENDEGQLICK